MTEQRHNHHSILVNTVAPLRASSDFKEIL